MQLSARYKAVSEILELVFLDEKPADGLVNEYFRARKYIGSSDRRFITEEVWQIIRNRRKLEFDSGSNDTRKILAVYLKDKNLDEIFDGSKYGLSPLSEGEKEILKQVQDDRIVYPLSVEAEVPEWLFEKSSFLSSQCSLSKDDNPTQPPLKLREGNIDVLSFLKALNQPATADFRVNVKHRDFILEKLKTEGLDFYPTPYSNIGIRSDTRVNLNNCIAYQDGEIEVQDEASQIACILSDIKPSDKIIDYCCGAGGKSLTISYLMQNQGKIFVHDINWSRLEAIKDRAVRLNVKNIEIVKDVVDNDYDVFLIDAPCSGSGTWRRSPDAKFRLTPRRLKELTKIQEDILEKGYDSIKQGGKIIYMTCSILKDENEDIIKRFLSRHKDMNLVNIKNIWNEKIPQPYPCSDEFSLRLSPLYTNTDGFFVCILTKRA